MRKEIISLLIACTVSMPLSALRDPLPRMKYQQKEMKTDLGVGLWAVPIPVDYDNDGKMDLLVVCPDTPFKGMHFFKNIGKGKELFFAPPVQLDSGMQNVRASYVGKELHVMKPGVEFREFAKYHFKAPLKLTVDKDPAKDMGKLRSNMWNMVDYDGDGDLDIVVGIDDWADYGWDNAFNADGKWTRGPLHGYLYLLENNNEQYTNKGRIASTQGDELKTYGAPCPSFQDFDNDGDLDIICGEFLDRFYWMENVGTRKAPRYASPRFLENESGVLKMHLEMIVPVGVDFDNDGDIDLIVGDEDGRVAFVENTGKKINGMPHFKSPVYLQQQADNVKFGALSTPYSIDWDGDGDEDLICGNSSGNIAFIENTDGGYPPAYAPPRLMTVGGKPIHILAGENGSIQGPAEAKWGYTVLNVADWDGDGKLDVIINSIFGEIVWFKGNGKGIDLAEPAKMKVAWEGTAPKPRWNWWTPGKTDLVTQWRTSPCVVDWNKDGLQDIISLDTEGYLTYFERFKKDGELWLKPGKRIFYGLGASNFTSKNEIISLGSGELRLNDREAGGSGRRKLTIADWDGDGDMDIIINSMNTAWFENIKTENGKSYFEFRGDLSTHRLAGHTTCPTVVKWNKNALPDILLGAEDGHFYWLKR